MNYLLDGQETERLFFRRIKATDCNDWLPFFEDSLTSNYWTSDRKLPALACKEWYNSQHWRYSNNKGGMNAVIEKRSGKLTGHCGLLLQVVDGLEELEIAYSFLPRFWGNGYAIEAAKKCKEFAFENNLCQSLISIISISNKPSQKVALNNGMHVVKTTVYKGNEVYIFRINKT